MAGVRQSRAMASDPTAPRAGTDSAASGPNPDAAGPGPSAEAEAPGISELLEQLSADRLWLLQQIDAGAWPELRLDLAALERELGQVLEQAAERLKP